METLSNCPKVEKCPIYLKNVFFNPNAGETYRKNYRTAGKKKFTSSKRYLGLEGIGKTTH